MPTPFKQNRRLSLLAAFANRFASALRPVAADMKPHGMLAGSKPVDDLSEAGQRGSKAAGFPSIPSIWHGPSTQPPTKAALFPPYR
jgi:hypothetical protein